MNTLAAPLSKLEVKQVTPEVRFLCGLIDAHRAHADDNYDRTMERLERVEDKARRINERLTRSESE